MKFKIPFIKHSSKNIKITDKMIDDIVSIESDMNNDIFSIESLEKITELYSVR